jgi:hypothetical protein
MVALIMEEYAMRQPPDEKKTFFESIYLFIINFLTLGTFPDNSFSIILRAETRFDYNWIQKISYIHDDERTDFEKDFIERMKEKYKWGMYETSHLYGRAPPNLRRTYNKLHTDICHLLHD